MQKPRDIEIDENDPFKNDLLDRETEIKNLTPILLNYNDPLVLALDAPWGAGKTTFVRIWQAYLKQQGNWCIGFNAWETDFADDPLIVLVAEFNKWFKEKLNPSEFEKWTEGVKNALPNIAKRVTVAAVKGATFGALDIRTDLERTAAELTGNITSDMLENFNKQSNSIKQFKELIADILDNSPVEQKNLVIFIDELDRCRPTYAIELLERIKHLFSIERLVFVLSTDTTQLAHSIRAIYGNEFDGKKYLQRFIDLDYALKKPEIEQYLENLFTSLGLNEAFEERTLKNDRDITKRCFIFMANRFDLKPRDINLLLIRLRLILYAVPDNHYLDVPLLIPLLILRWKNKSLYEQYVTDTSIAHDVIKFLFGSLLPSETNNNVRVDYVIYTIIGFLIAPNYKNNEMFDFLLKPYQPNNISDSRTESIIRYANEPRQDHGQSYFKHETTLERIEFVQKFQI